MTAKLHRLVNKIPIPALRTINTYIMNCGSSTVLFDPGMTSEGASNISSYLKRNNFPSHLIIVLTHFHVDHVAATPRLNPDEVYMHNADRSHIVRMVDEWPLVLDIMKEVFAKGGMPEAEVNLLDKKHPAMSRIDVFKSLRELEPKPLPKKLTIGDCVFKVIHTPGHTPGSMAVHIGDRHYIVGDTVLIDITPNIALIDWSTNPLYDYLNSLRKLSSLDPVKLYPGHRDIIDEPKRRIKELMIHHNHRLSEVLAILDNAKKPLTAYEVASKMTWDVAFKEWSEFPIAQKYFALGEALSHLKYLVVKGKVALEESNGAYKFSIT
ncbi:MAG: MBL fold metallo-hydrolase [Desulfurococcales archaeon]|nr:MBL fold metallo-hydrolase [Desulfurococcales archaeon]